MRCESVTQQSVSLRRPQFSAGRCDAVMRIEACRDDMHARMICTTSGGHWRTLGLRSTAAIAAFCLIYCYIIALPIVSTFFAAHWLTAVTSYACRTCFLLIKSNIKVRSSVNQRSSEIRQIVRCSTHTQHVWRQELCCCQAMCLEQLPPLNTLTYLLTNRRRTGCLSRFL